MKLTGNLKEQVEKAKTKEEAKETIRKAGMLLDDDELEHVSGGTNEETRDLAKKMLVNDIRVIDSRLEKFYQVKADFNDNEDNKYRDIKTGAELSHQDVLEKINKGGRINLSNTHFLP